MNSKNKIKNPYIAISFKRWFDILILSLIATLIYVVISPLLNTYYPEFKSVMKNFPIWIEYLIYIFIFTLLWLPSVRYGNLFSRTFFSSSFYIYPPFWLACIISILATCILSRYIPISSNDQISPIPFIIVFKALGFVFAGAVIAVGYYKLIHWYPLPSDKEQNNHVYKTIKPDNEVADPLLLWIKEERPIAKIDQDRLNNKPFADRIINVLQQPKVTITVIGGYGAGKSSILNMVKNYLKTSGTIITSNSVFITCDVSGWGLKKGSAAETILKQLIQTCAQHVDCLGLSNLPEQYVASFGHVSSWSKVLSGLLSLSYDPMLALQRIDRVLLAIDKRVVMFFEDLDRNWQGNDFWVEIVALLDRLKNLDRVSFVLAITETREIGNIINRISDHIEIVPKLSFDQVSKFYKV